MLTHPDNYPHALRVIVALAIACISIPLGSADSAADSPPATLLRMTPDGDDIEPPSEIVFQFDKPMVPLGRMERGAKEIAITFSPPLDCQWRWQNPSALSCVILDNARPTPATRYSVSIPTAFDKTSAVPLTSSYSKAFTTSLPAITSVWVSTWSGPAMPRVQIVTNQSVTKESLSEHLYFEDEQHEVHRVLAAEVTPNPEHSQSDEERVKETGILWMITPQRELPHNSAVSLRISPGLSSTKGSQQGMEDRPLTSFHTFADFRFLGITCRDLGGNILFVPTGAGANPTTKDTQRCDPLNAIQLTFNAPISKDTIAPALTSQPDLRGGRTDFDPWESTPSYSQREAEHLKDQHYYLNLPYGLKANTTYTFTAPAGRVNDDFDRVLAADLAISFTTDNRAARFVLDNRHSVLEKETDSKLPVVVNNIDTLKVSYQTLTSDGIQGGLSTTLTPFKATNISYPFPIDIRSLLGGRSGVVQGTITGKPPQKFDNTQRFFSQVTPYAVHAKIGHFNSLVWVTSMATGTQVGDARVSLIVDTVSKLSAKPTVVASGATNANGIATLPGLVSLDPKLEHIEQWDESKPRFLLKVEKDDDVALLPLSWDYQVYDSEVYAYTRPRHGHIRTWGTTAQGLYRVGDRVQFALWVRDQNNERFIAPPQERYSLEVKDPTDKVVFQIPQVTLSEFGSFAAEFTTGTNATVGWYTFVLKATFSGESWEPLRVLISDFTPAPFKVTNDLQATSFRLGDRVTARTEARLHSGGPYAEAATRVTARLVGTTFTPRDPRTKGFTFSTVLSDKTVTEREERLDAKGDLLTSFDILGYDLPYGQLIVESAVRDDRGKFVAALSKAPYIGRSRFSGVKQDDWILSSGTQSSFSAVVVDELGELAQGQAVQLLVEYEDVQVARVKSAGNTYTNRYEKKWVPVQACERLSGVAPVTCPFTPSSPGQYRCTARVRDQEGREHTSSIEKWAVGRGDVVWQTETNNQLQIIPEKTTYKVGDTARFMVQNPFPTAFALLTVERFGVQKVWNQTITEPSTVIEVPVTPDHIPGFFFSATIMSPRVDMSVDGQVDLGKPAFRMGYAQITVDDPAKQLTINVTADKATYKPRETVTVNVSLTPQSAPVPPVEFAVTVIDESVFDLISTGRSYFDPYRGFYSLDGLDVKNFNLLKMLLGRQHFEKKGATPGGDGGGKLDMRSVQKYVTYWNPGIRPDADGRASFSFEAPDNLTGWKVFALALTREDRMGLGEGRFIVSKDTEVRSATPNQVRRGDTFSAVFTVMNRLDKPRTLSIETYTEGDSISATPQKLSLLAEPFKRYPVAITASAIKEGVAYLTVKAADAIDNDALRVSLPVLPRTSTQTVATFGSSEGSAVEQPVQIPSEIDPQQGSIGAVLSSSLLGGLDGAFAYMRDYPYECWEQKLSKAVMAAYSLELKSFLPPSFTWPNAKDVVTQTLRSVSEHQAPNGGMTFYTASDEYVSPYLSAFTALAFTWLNELGYSAPQEAHEKLRRYLDGALRNDVFDSSWSNSMKTSVRAVALAALAQDTANQALKGSSTISASDISRLSSNLPEMGIFGQSLYLQAALALGTSAKSAQEHATRRILSASSESNATLSLKDRQTQLSPWLLDSSMRSQCAALDALISANSANSSGAKKLLEPRLEKLARTIMLDRKRKDRWENTQENLFCIRALSRHAKHYEQANSNLSVDVVVGEQKLATLALKQGSGEPVEVSRPLTMTDADSSTKVTLSPSGAGRFYYSTRLTSALKEPKSEPIHAGIEVTREFAVQRNGTWIALVSPMHIQRGDLVTVNLFVRISSPRYFVVVSDPIPGGLEPVNRNLATSSTVDADPRGFAGPATSLWFAQPGWIDAGEGRGSFYHRELRHASARFYSEYLEPGNYHLSYTAQAIASGRFIVPPAHAETMYDPDIFGDSSSGILNIE